MVVAHGLWSELPAHTRMIKNSGMFYRIIDFFCILFVRHASNIIVVSYTRIKRFLHKIPEEEIVSVSFITGQMLIGYFL